MTMTPLNSTEPGRPVLLDDPDAPFSFHDPDEVPTTRGMVESTESEARALGAVGCHQCYEDVPGGSMLPDYRFPYLEPIETLRGVFQ